MEKIPRFYQDLGKYLKPGKVLIIYGPRQVGKTTLLIDFLAASSLKYKLDSGDNIKVQQILSSSNFDALRTYVEGYDLLAIDEAQRIPQVGQGLKILVDQVPGLRIIATGSSSFELAGQLGEPLTGRKTTLTLYPISQLELKTLYNLHELKEKLAEWLVFGAYPEVATTPSKKEKTSLLEEITHSYLFKDILEMEKLKSPKVLIDLVRLLAFQVGNEVSLSELATQVSIDYKTVGRYLALLEKSFVIYPLGGFSKNLREEITRKNKYYFYDNGIRNALIANFNELALRNDVGSLWENFLVIERLKKRAYEEIHANDYFWRTWSKKEVDLVEEREGKLFGYEFKWNERKVKKPRTWLETYPDATFEGITPANYLSFLT